MAIAAHHKWPLKTTDIKYAFLQGKDIERVVYVTPPKEAQNRNQWRIWRLKKSLYGLNDARQFYDSIEEELKKLGVTRSPVDPALFYQEKEGKVIGIIATHIDDFIHCGTQAFDTEVMDKLRQRFVAGKLEEGAFSYVGFTVKQSSEGIILDQSHYVQDLETAVICLRRAMEKDHPLSKGEQKQYRSLVGKCNWAARGTRPDIAFEVIEMSTKFKQPKLEDLVRANKNIIRLKEGPAYVSFPDLGSIDKWKFVAMSGASFANMNDGCSSCGGHLIMIVGEGDKCCVLAWISKKIKRFVKSTLAAEMLSFTEALEHAVYLRHVVMELVGGKDTIPIVGIVDNKSTVDALHSTKAVEDKRLRIDVSIAKEMLRKGVVHSVHWVPGSRMIADVLTKRGVAGFQILDLIQSGNYGGLNVL